MVQPERTEAHLAVHEPLQLQLRDAQLAVLLRQAPARLGEVDLRAPHHAHVFRRLPQLQLIGPLQLEVLKTPGRRRRGWRE